MRAERLELSTVQFLRLPPLTLWATRAPTRKLNTGGETRTHMGRLLRTVRLPFAPLPRERYWGRESNPQWDLPAATSAPCVCLYATPARASSPGEGLEPSLPAPKTGVLPLDDPGLEERTRHDSNVRPQAPQACALILLSYGFIISKAEGVGVEPTGASCSDSFRDCSACQVPNLPSVGRDARTRTGIGGFGVRLSSL